MHLQPVRRWPMLFSAPLEVARTNAFTFGLELDERLGQVRAHEAVGAGDENRACLRMRRYARRAGRRVRTASTSRYRRRTRMQRRRSAGAGALGSGVLTGISTAVVSGSAAILGVILSRKFGNGARDRRLLRGLRRLPRGRPRRGRAPRGRAAPVRLGPHGRAARARGRRVDGGARRCPSSPSSSSRSPGRTASRAR